MNAFKQYFSRHAVYDISCKIIIKKCLWGYYRDRVSYIKEKQHQTNKPFTRSVHEQRQQDSCYSTKNGKPIHCFQSCANKSDDKEFKKKGKRHNKVNKERKTPAISNICSECFPMLNSGLCSMKRLGVLDFLFVGCFSIAGQLQVTPAIPT